MAENDCPDQCLTVEQRERIMRECIVGDRAWPVGRIPGEAFMIDVSGNYCTWDAGDNLIVRDWV